MVDGGGLENHCTRKGPGGSNPSSSAKQVIISQLIAGACSARDQDRFDSYPAQILSFRSFSHLQEDALAVEQPHRNEADRGEADRIGKRGPAPVRNACENVLAQKSDHVGPRPG